MNVCKSFLYQKGNAIGPGYGRFLGMERAEDRNKFEMLKGIMGRCNKIINLINFLIMTNPICNVDLRSLMGVTQGVGDSIPDRTLKRC